MAKTVEELVKTAYDNAVVNGYKGHLDEMSDDQLTCDMMNCDSDLELCSYNDVLAAVRANRSREWK